MKNTVYSIAGFIVEIKDNFGGIKSFGKKYISPDKNADFSVSVTKADIIREKELCTSECSAAYLERAAACRKLANLLPEKDCMLIHGSVIDVNGIGTVFTAPSGTGKTTHTLLWKKLLGEKLTVINGDKPILRFTKDGIYAYGTPWCGKEGFSENKYTRLKNLCLIKRSDTNRVYPLSRDEAVSVLLNEMFIPEDPYIFSKSLELADRIVSECSLYTVECNTDIEAAKISHSAIYGGKEKL